MSRSRSRPVTLVGALGGLVGLASAVGCAPPPEVSQASIVNGVRETGYPAVYYIEHRLRRGSASCTATLISPHVVLTARHCIVNAAGDAADDPSVFSVYTGTDRRSFGPPPFGYVVTRAEIIPGSTANINDGLATDLGILILRDVPPETPVPVARDVRPSTLVGMTGTAVGFGQQPDGSFGIKMRGVAPIVEVRGGTIFVDPTVCSGDSGGPLFGPDGRLYGVASFIYSLTMADPVCGTAPGAYNDVYAHLEWVNSIIESTGDACFPNPETCDGADNDCNGRIDEFCDPLGSYCEADEGCYGGRCADTSQGPLCAQECDFTRPNAGCTEGFICANTPGTCDGFCVPGTLGSASLESPCVEDAECQSGVCRDPGDGRPRCLNACQFNAGDCIEGQICAADESTCGVCLPAAMAAAPRGLGELCAANEECASGTCTMREGLGECTSSCRSGTCSAGFVCETGRCVERRTLPAGSACHTSVDCARGALCATQGDRRWCTTTCSTARTCPEDFECASVSGSSICVPMAGIPGELCDSDAACVSGTCRVHPSSGRRLCTTACDTERHCGVGFICDALSDGSRACFRPEPPPPPAMPGHCSAQRHAPSSSALLVTLLSGLGCVLGRRRRDHHRH